MAHIDLLDAQAWADNVKLGLGTIDVALEAQVATEAFAKIAAAPYNTTLWVDSTTTPKLVKSIVSMMYVSWIFQRTYSEDNNISNYALLLMQRAEGLIVKIVDGTLDLPETGIDSKATIGAAFYPNDISTFLQPTLTDASLGPAAFSMGMRF